MLAFLILMTMLDIHNERNKGMERFKMYFVSPSFSQWLVVFMFHAVLFVNFFFFFSEDDEELPDDSVGFI